MHGLIWLLDRRRLANLAFCVVAFSVAAMAALEFELMRTSSADQYSQLVRWFHLPLFLFTAGLVFFVRLHFGTGRDALGWTVIGLRGVVSAANLVAPSTATWQVLRLEQIPLLGEFATASAQSAVRPLQWLATLTTLLLLLYVIDASIALARTPAPGAGRKAAVVGGAIVAFVVIGTLQTQLVIWGVMRMPVMLSPPFLIILAAITYELSRDIVASTRIELEAREQRIQLTHLSRVAMLGELSGGFAHELNQPLTAILANAQAAQRFIANKTGSPEVLSEILQDIVAADVRAGEVIRRLRTLFKRGETQFRPLDVNALVGEVLDIVRGDLVTRSIDVRLDLGASLPAVSGDRVELEQVLLNLVVNASEAMSAGTAPGSRILTVRTESEAGMAKVSFIDSGPGFTAEQHRRMFEAFYTTKAQGLGLGLSISRAIVRVHNGHLWGDANPGGGASFHITLPPA